MKQITAQNRGFTLIEIIIVITLMVILAGSTLVNVTSFYQNQGTEDDIRTLASEFRGAYTKATGVFYPAGCTNLTGYTVSMTSGGKDVSLRADCAVPSTTIKQGVLKTTNFSSNYSFTISVPTGVTTPDPIDIEIRNDGNTAVTKTVRVSSYGIFEIL